MKVTAYSVGAEEKEFFEKHRAAFGAEMRYVAEKPTLENADEAAGADCVSVLSSVVISDEMYDRYKALGVRLAVTRTIGVEHMNTEYAEKIGMPVRSITYSAASVADYAIMMMLMVLRNVKPMMQRYLGQDYTAHGIRGRELPDMTVGIIGAGRIGRTTAAHLSGFGCRVAYWDRNKKPDMDGVAEYAALDDLLEQSDIVSLHLALCGETRHFIDMEKIGKMKRGAVLINTARGPLVDSGALIDALESGKLGGAGLDVFDGDRLIYYRDFKNAIIQPRDMAVLNSMPNVLMLPHMAYYTDRASEDMVRNSLACAAEFFEKTKKG
jgi:lactate dehydrogenase-like 2-hydroxyacid dehydrogenase